MSLYVYIDLTHLLFGFYKHSLVADIDINYFEL